MPDTYLPHHDPDVETLVRPRYLSGPGDRASVVTAFEPLRGWRVEALGPSRAAVMATSPCHRVHVGYPDRYGPRRQTGDGSGEEQPRP